MSVLFDLSVKETVAVLCVSVTTAVSPKSKSKQNQHRKSCKCIFLCNRYPVDKKLAVMVSIKLIYPHTIYYNPDILFISEICFYYMSIRLLLRYDESN